MSPAPGPCTGSGGASTEPWRTCVWAPTLRGGAHIAGWATLDGFIANRSAAGQSPLLQQRDALDVVRHREQVEGPQPLQPVAVLGEDRDVARERGRVAGDVRDRPRRPVDDLLDHGAPRALARRVEHDQVERLVVRRGEHPVDGAGRDLRRASPRLRRACRQASRSASTATSRGPGPTASAEERRRTGRRRRRGRAPTRPAAAAARRGPSRPAPRARRGGPARSRRRRPRRRGRAPRDAAAPLGLEQALVDGHDLVGAVLAHAAPAVGQLDVALPGAPVQAVVVAGDRLDLDRDVEAAPAGTAARGRRRPSASRCAGSATCWKSQPPQASGPAYGHGGSTRSGEAVSDRDGVGAPEPVALGALGDHDARRTRRAARAGRRRRVSRLDRLVRRPPGRRSGRRARPARPRR